MKSDCRYTQIQLMVRASNVLLFRRQDKKGRRSLGFSIFLALRFERELSLTARGVCASS